MIDEPTVARLLTLSEAMKVVEGAFIAHACGRGRLFPAVKEKYSDVGSFSSRAA
jgi:hypothetical protein